MVCRVQNFGSRTVIMGDIWRNLDLFIIVHVHLLSILEWAFDAFVSVFVPYF